MRDMCICGKKIAANNTKGAVDKMRTDVLPKVSGDAGSWVVGTDAASELTNMGEQMITSTSGSSGYTVWLSARLTGATTVEFTWGMNFETWKIVLSYWPQGGSTTTVDVTGKSSYTVTFAAGKTYYAKASAWWEAQRIDSTTITFTTQMQILSIWVNYGTDGKAQVTVAANAPIGTNSRCYYKEHTSSSYTSVGITPGQCVAGAYYGYATLSGLQEKCTYDYYVKLYTPDGQGTVTSGTKSFEYLTPNIDITWTPDKTSADITWTTPYSTTNDYVSINGKTVYATSGTTHTAHVTNLVPATQYSFTVHSFYGGLELTKSDSGYTKMQISAISVRRELVDVSNTKIMVKVWWCTGNAGPSDISTNQITYSSLLGSSTTPIQGQYYSHDVGGYWYYAQFSLTNPARMKNVVVSITITCTYIRTPNPTTETFSMAITTYLDDDCDGLFNEEEAYYGTNPGKADTDSDGWSDYQEVYIYPSNPKEVNPFPYFGFTWHFRWEWVGFTHPYWGSVDNNFFVSSDFQYIWDNYFYPTHARTIRCDIRFVDYVDDNGNINDDGWRQIYRVVNLCRWAKYHAANIYLVLKGYEDWNVFDPKCHYHQDYIYRVKIFVKNLIDLFWVDVDAYNRIVAYQVDNEMNHWYHHKNWPVDRQKALLVGGSHAIREAEIEMGISKPIWGYTPICINPSYDWMQGDYGSLRNYLKMILDDANSRVDIIGLDYYPATWVDLPVDTLKQTVESLCKEFGLQSGYRKYILVAETGFSTWGYRPDEHQRNYYQQVSFLLKNYYYSGGKEKGFLGVLWYEFSSMDKGLTPHEDYFGITVRNDDGTICRTKCTWDWLKDELTPS